MRASSFPTVGIAQDEFLAFYDATVHPLFSYLFRATGGNRDLAEDLSQEVFAIALRRARHGAHDPLTISWAITVGRNRLIDLWRRTTREQRRLASLEVVATIDTADDEHDELLEQVRGLPPMQQAAVALHYLDGLSVTEVATRLGKTTKATESLLSRARQTLRNPGDIPT